MDHERVWAEIDLDCIAYNVRVIKNQLPSHSKLMAVVKADGYGHGAVESAKIMLYNGADELGVAIADEGIQLRNHNIHVPILVFGYTPITRINDAIESGLTQTVFSLDMCRVLDQAAHKLNKKAAIHIKIDTGMSRLGFLPCDSTVTDIIEIMNLPNVHVEGIYTHFATSDSLDDSFTVEQFNRFQNLLSRLSEKSIHIPVKHVSNSGAIVGCPNLSMDMVRSGILLYGLAPSAEMGTGRFSLKPAMSLKTCTSYIKRLDKGVSVSYGRRFITERESIVATVPVGYADGYLRGMTNGGHVLMSGQYCPIIGNICMDQFMIDVTDLHNPKTGDEIVLIGKQGEREITADQVANIMGTISYEIVCTVGKRVPRLYVKNNEIIKKLNL